MFWKKFFAGNPTKGDPDLEEAVAFLEWLQKRSAERDSWLPPDFSRFGRKQFVKQFAEYAVSKLGDIPPEQKAAVVKQFISDFDTETFSRYEDPMTFAFIKRMTAKINKICDSRNIRLDRQPLFGSLATGRINGMAININNRKYYLILIEDGILGFANLFSKCISSMFPIKGFDNGQRTFSSDPDDIKKRIMAEPLICERFFDVVASYLVRGSPHAAKQYFGDPEYIGMASVIRDGIEYFIFGHEYGHCAAGHLNRGDKRLAAMHAVAGEGGASAKVEEIIPQAWEDELEADAIGLIIALGVLHDEDRIDPSLGYNGIEAVFTCIDVIERALSVLETGEVKERLIDSHPPPILRRHGIRTLLTTMLGEERAKASIQLADITANAVELCWERVGPAFLAMHRDGIRPHPRWRSPAQSA